MTLTALLAGTFAALVVGTVVGQVLRLTVRTERARQTIANMNARIAAWWVLCGLMAAALLCNHLAVFLLFAVFSTLALREFLQITRMGRDVQVLLACLTLLHYGLLWMEWSPAGTAALPAGAFLLLAVWHLKGGRTEGYLQRTAETWWGWAAATWSLSFAPAQLTLRIAGNSETLLFYFLLVVQSSDVLQYIAGKLLGRHTIAPWISPNKTWEGMIGGVGGATILGTLLYRATPFSPLEAAGICVSVTLAGFAGGLVMSAIKRDRGVKDYGTLIAGHGGVFDRVDSLCFSAPFFYHCVRYFYTA